MRVPSTEVQNRMSWLSFMPDDTAPMRRTTGDFRDMLAVEKPNCEYCYE